MGDDCWKGHRDRGGTHLSKQGWESNNSKYQVLPHQTAKPLAESNRLTNYISFSESHQTRAGHIPDLGKADGPTGDAVSRSRRFDLDLTDAAAINVARYARSL